MDEDNTPENRRDPQFSWLGDIPECCGETVRRYGLLVEEEQKNRKAIATGSSPDRDQQFGIIRDLRESFEWAGNPIISVDTKKKELVGLFANSGRTWTRESVSTYDHDFRSNASAIAVPYGIYDVLDNTGIVVVGTSSDTPAFAVQCIASWWRYRGRHQYHGKRELLHRLFSEISKNWAGRPLDSLETILNYIHTTTTHGGLEVRSYLDSREYAKGMKISAAQMKALALETGSDLARWNYTFSPRISA